MTQPDSSPSSWTVRRISLVLGLVAGLAVLLTLADPGITVDEPLDVRPGRVYVSTLLSKGFGFFSRDSVTRVFADNKEHPPLGRWLLGIASTLGEPFEVMILGGPDPVGVYVVAGRLAPALVFAILVGVVAGEAGRRYGRAGAVAAGFALMAMPRVFSHAHLGALDLFIAAAWCVALIAADRALDSAKPTQSMAIAGLFWGLALLVKIHAWLLPPIVLVRALIGIGPKRAIVPLACWTAVGLAVFFAGWPWLWYDSVPRLLAYLGTGVERSTILVTYFGQVYRDRDVPWHFPWVYFLATVPVGLHGLGLVGTAVALRGRERGGLFLAATIVAILGLFSTNVPVYDGERLFLLVFPLWAILIGRGFAWLWDRLASAKRRAMLGVLLVAQGYGLVMIHPFGLSYYNLLVGGLPGADRMGLELAYWSESVDPTLLRRLASLPNPGETLALAPTLAPGQGANSTGRDLARRKLVLQDEAGAETAEWLVVTYRTAYWNDATRRFVASGDVVLVRSRAGVKLSAVVRRRKAATPPGHHGIKL